MVAISQEIVYTNARHEISETLKSLPVFIGLDNHQLSKLETIASLLNLESGQAVFTEGEKSDNLYIVLSGNIRLETYVPSIGNLEYYTAEAPDLFGWSCMTVNIRQRISTARAAVASKVLSLDGKVLRQMCDEDPRMGYVIMRRVVNVSANRLLAIRLQLYDTIVRISIDNRED